MGFAMRHPKPSKGGRGKKLATSGEFSGVSHQRVSDARAILEYSREIAEAVICGEKFLKAALDEARLSQGGLRNDRTRLAKLRDERPDLAELVSTETLSLDDALAKATAEREDLSEAGEWRRCFDKPSANGQFYPSVE